MCVKLIDEFLEALLSIYETVCDLLTNLFTMKKKIHHKIVTEAFKHIKVFANHSVFEFFIILRGEQLNMYIEKK